MVGLCEAKFHFGINYNERFQYISHNAFPWAINRYDKGKRIALSNKFEKHGINKY